MTLLPVGSLLITNVTPEIWNAPVSALPQVIGRLPTCEIVIPSTYSHVSRQHALIGANQEGIWIRDLGSSGGTSINGVPLLPNRQTRAVFGDRVSLAGLELYIVSPQTIELHDASSIHADDSQMTGTGLRLGGAGLIDSFQDVRLKCLSPAELEVVRWISRGLMKFDEIGERLFRSPHTVRTQLNSIYRKLNVHSREELLSWMRRCELAWTTPDRANKDDPPSLRKTIH